MFDTQYCTHLEYLTTGEQERLNETSCTIILDRYFKDNISINNIIEDTIDPFDELLLIYKKMTPQKYNKIVKIFTENMDYYFAKIINKINESPDGLLLDILGSLLYSFNIEYYKKIASYIKSVHNGMNDVIKGHLIEIIGNWDEIPADIRIKDLTLAKKSFNKEYLLLFIDDIIKDIKDNE